MKKIIVTLIGLLFMQLMYSQECETEDLDSVTFASLPWIGNNQYLLDFLDSINGSTIMSRMDNNGLSDGIFQVPIKANVYYNSTYPGITDEEVQQYIRSANERFWNNGVRIHFYLTNCGISRFNSSLAYLDTETKKDAVMIHENHNNAITVHFVYYATGVSGRAFLPYKGNDFSCFVRTEGEYHSYYANTLTHELGHTLGLLHTFGGKSTDNAEQGNCKQECVDRNRMQEGYCLFNWGKKCEVNGDGLCDTDADPNWSNDNGTIVDCKTWNYTGSNTDYYTDNYGALWNKSGNNNSIQNYMSYTNGYGCRNSFTPMQKSVMYLTLNRYNPLGYTILDRFKYNQNLDRYEPDNYWFGGSLLTMEALGNKIVLNTQQHHTFHHAENTSNNLMACDIDWVYFHNNTGSAKDFIIQTLAVDGKPVPDTKITLFNVSSAGALGSQITLDDNLSSNFSKITRNLAIGYYAVKIENKITNVSLDGSKGHYYIRVDACYDKTLPKVTGANSICGSSQTYSVSNIPAGATVTWYQTHNDLILTPSGNSCIVAARTRGDVMLYAVVSFCGMLDTFSKKITINMPQYVYFASESYRTAYPDVFDEIGLNMQCYRNIGGGVDYTAHYENYTSITWTKLSSYPAATSALWSSHVGGDPRKINVHLRVANASLTLKADVTNSCGTISNTFTFLSNGTSCSTSMMRGISETSEIDYYDIYMSHQTLIIAYKGEEENKSELMKIIISDKMGNIILEKTDGSIKEERIQIDMSLYKSDNYYVILQYADGNIEPQQVAKF